MMAMEFLESLAHRVPQLYSKLLPIPCFLCGQPSSHSTLCEACIADLPLLDKSCLKCAAPISQGDICGVCLQHPPHQDITRCLLHYQEPVDRCIAAFKYQHQLGFARCFANLLVSKRSFSTRKPDCLIPIPLHPNRLRQRGYNQSLELCKVLSRKLHIPIAHNYLRKIRDTPPQATIPLKQRRHNLQNAYSCSGGKAARHVVLVDDVFTSGNTCGEAARILRQAGAETIEVWTIARAIRHH